MSVLPSVLCASAENILEPASDPHGLFMAVCLSRNTPGVVVRRSHHAFKASNLSSNMPTSLSSSTQSSAPRCSVTCSTVFAPGIGTAPAAAQAGLSEDVDILEVGAEQSCMLCSNAH